MSYEDNERQALKMANAGRIKEQMRKNENVCEKEIVEKRSTNKVALISLGLAALGVCTLALGYAATKSKLKGTKVDPRTGFTYIDQNNSKNPTSEEIFDEIFKRNGK